MRFMHVADLHLGNQQYNLDVRFNDFYLAFRKTVDIALESGIDVYVIAGDLFHKAAVNPLTLLQAEDGLRALREAGIKVLAVSGNHDRPRGRDSFSWLHYLHRNEYLHLLEPDLEVNDSCLGPEEGYVDIDGVRFIGVPWYGASSSAVMNRVSNDIDGLSRDGIRNSVLITHAGIENQVPDVGGCLRLSDLSPLRKHVQYIATGHLHKPFVVDDWIHNPGAIENCDFNEEAFRVHGKGAFIVEMQADGFVAVEKVVVAGRPFFTLSFATDIYSSPTELQSALRERLRNDSKSWQTNGQQPLVRVVLHGHLAFDRSELDFDDDVRLLQSELNLLLLRLHPAVDGYNISLSTGDEIPFDILEKQVFEELARTDIRYSHSAEAWGIFMRQIKDLALRDMPPDEIYEQFREQTRRFGKAQ